MALVGDGTARQGCVGKDLETITFVPGTDEQSSRQSGSVGGHSIGDLAADLAPSSVADFQLGRLLGRTVPKDVINEPSCRNQRVASREDRGDRESGYCRQIGRR